MITKENTYFTSDTHFGHANIIRFCNRPFLNVKEMDEELIARWNEKVGPNDNIFHLGDFSMHSPGKTKEIISRLNGNKFLIGGNHEKSVMKSHEVKKMFAWIKPDYQLRISGEDGYDPVNIHLYHYKCSVWNKSFHGSWHLYGHSHGNNEHNPIGKSFDIGVDCHNYYPLSFYEVKDIMDTREIGG